MSSLFRSMNININIMISGVDVQRKRVNLFYLSRYLPRPLFNDIFNSN